MASARVVAPLVLALSAGPALATDFTVGPPGSGADFESIQAAIDAAGGSFDRVFVLPGIYGEILTIDKDLDLIGSGPGASILQNTLDGALGKSVPVVVQDLGANERVRIAGFGFEATPSPFAPVYDSFLEVRGCEGPVTLAELEARGPQSPPILNNLSAALLSIQSSDRVVLDRCRLEAASGSVLGSSPPVAPASVRIRGASVWINDCTLTGGIGGDNAFAGISLGGPGLDVADSEVTLAWTGVLGGDGAQVGLTTITPGAGDAGPAVLAAGSTTTVRIDGGATSSLRGGDGGFVPDSPGGLGGPGLVLTDGAQAIVDEAAELFGGLDAGGAAAAEPVVAADGALTLRPFTTVALRTTATRAFPGETFELEVAGEPGDLVALFSDNQSAAPLPLPGFAGTALIAPAVSETLIPVLLDATGRGIRPVQVPVLAPAGARRYLQAVNLLTFAEPAISAVAFATVAF